MHKRWAMLWVVIGVGLWPLTQAIAAEVRMFPPPPPLKSPIEGASDDEEESGKTPGVG